MRSTKNLQARRQGFTQSARGVFTELPPQGWPLQSRRGLLRHHIQISFLFQREFWVCEMRSLHGGRIHFCSYTERKYVCIFSVLRCDFLGAGVSFACPKRMWQSVYTAEIRTSWATQPISPLPHIPSCTRRVNSEGEASPHHRPSAGQADTFAADFVFSCFMGH